MTGVVILVTTTIGSIPGRRKKKKTGTSALSALTPANESAVDLSAWGKRTYYNHEVRYSTAMHRGTFKSSKSREVSGYCLLIGA